MGKYIIKAPVFSKSSMSVKWLYLDETDEEDEAIDISQEMLGTDSKGRLSTIFYVSDASDNEDDESFDTLFDPFGDMSQFSEEDAI